MREIERGADVLLTKETSQTREWIVVGGDDKEDGE